MIQAEAFEALASSSKGITKLRQLILELAVRGLLVPQDPNDEPASVLLEKIAVEKQRLIKEGKIKKQGPLPKISDIEKPFTLPTRWEYARFGDIAFQITDGAHHTPTYVTEGIPFLSVKDLSSGYLDLSNTRFISKEQHNDLIKRCCPQRGDLLLTKVGTTGIPVLIDTDLEFSLFVSVALIKYSQNNISGQYLTLLVKSPLVKKQSDDGTEGVGNKNLVLRKINNFILALPPLSEQHRIVAKVDELMALCDQLEQRQNHSNIVHQRLLQTLLESLTQAADNGVFQKIWSQITAYFDTLFTTEASIDQLKQVILQLAVMGKLVPQDPNDEPASVLLEKIAEEKARMVKEGKIKKQTPLPEVTELYEKPELPKGWMVTRFGELFNLISGQHLKPQEYSESYEIGMIPYLTGPAEFGEKYPSATRYTFEKRAVANPGDVLVTCKGSGVGKLNEVEAEIAISRQLMSIQPILITTKFTKLLASSLYDQIRSNIVGIAIPGISREDLMEIIIALPPLDEQHRITAKVDELMAICDLLKSRISKSQQTQEHLAAAIVEKAVA